MVETIKPLGDRVLVEPAPAEEKTTKYPEYAEKTTEETQAEEAEKTEEAESK